MAWSHGMRTRPLASLRRASPAPRRSGRSLRRGARACERGGGGEGPGRGETEQEQGAAERVDAALQRFRSPRIDDRGLPIADALVCGWMVPCTLAIGTLILRLPPPMWLTPALGVTNVRALTYLPAILSHGAQLAICWTAGALACRAFERERYAGDRALGTAIRAGAVATGLLVLATQLKLSAVLGVYPVLATYELEPGSAEDLLLGNTQGELVVDIIAEAGAMMLWRSYRGGLP